MASASRVFHFSKQSIQDKGLPATGKTWYRDAGRKSLALEVSHTGNRTFWFKKTHHGKRLDRTLGNFPDLAVKDARAQVDVLLGELAKHSSIISTAPTVRGSMTLDDFFEHWLKIHGKPHRPGTWEHDQELYNTHIKPELGALKIPTIKQAHIRELHSTIGSKVAKQTGKPMHRRANAMLQLVSIMFNCAKKWEMYVGDNPTAGIQKFKERSITRYLSKDEYARLEKALLDKDTVPYVRQATFLALFTGQRAAAVMGMKWKDVDFKQKRWTVTAEDSKNDDPISVPLDDAALGILEELKATRRPGAKWVFPATRGDGHRIFQHKYWYPVLDRANITEFRFHDLRHTYASWQAIIGTPINVIKESCGHRSIQTTLRYAHLNNDAVRKASGAAIAELTGGRKAQASKGGKL